MSKLTKSILIVTLILVADQILKIWIKTNMALGDEFSVIGNWFIIHFVENNGMAFGLEFAGQYGKMFLSVFRLVAILAIGWYLLKLIKKDLPMGFLACCFAHFCRGYRQPYRQCFLRAYFQRQLWQSGYAFPRSRRLCNFFARTGCRHVLFSAGSRPVSRMVSLLGRRRLPVFQAGI